MMIIFLNCLVTIDDTKMHDGHRMDFADPVNCLAKWVTLGNLPG